MGVVTENVICVANHARGLYARPSQGSESYLDVRVAMGSSRRTDDAIKADPTLQPAGGVVRHVDALGRVVIPVEIRKQLAIAANDPIEIGVRGDVVTLSKPRSVCVFCGAAADLLTYRERHVCSSCRGGLAGDAVSA